MLEQILQQCSRPDYVSAILVIVNSNKLHKHETNHKTKVNNPFSMLGTSVPNRPTNTPSSTQPLQNTWRSEYYERTDEIAWEPSSSKFERNKLDPGTREIFYREFTDSKAIISRVLHYLLASRIYRPISKIAVISTEGL